jgi:isoleucyl-tRNA synthetase
LPELPVFHDVSSRFDFPKTEKEILAFWDKHQVYGQSLRLREGGKPFVFYEGPPTANGLPHPGHCLTRAIKDLFPRYKTMTGHHCQRKGGWDTHGLPVEVEVCKELGIHSKDEIEAYGVEPFNRKCLESVFRYTKEWEEMTRRLGFWVNLDRAYVTYHKSYVESVWWSLKKLFDAGLLYQGHKIVWWWAQGGTALSAGEVGQGYREVDDPSVYVRFPLVMDDRAEKFIADCGLRIADLDQNRDREGAYFRSDQSRDREGAHSRSDQSRDRQGAHSRSDQSRDRQGAVTVQSGGPSPLQNNPSLTVGALKVTPISLLVWTTTPWTLPSNMFAAVNKDFEYAIVHDEDTGERLIFAKALVEPIARKLKKTGKWMIERTVKGSDLVGLRYVPPFRERYYDNVPYIEQTSFTWVGSLASPTSSEWPTAPNRPWRDVTSRLANQPHEKHVAWRILDAEFVTLESGTGLVHEAPAFGEVDFELLQKERLRFSDPEAVPLLCAVAANGTFCFGVEDTLSNQCPQYDSFRNRYEGRWVKDCDKDIIRDMKERGLLLHQEQYRHDYPFCWRAEEDPLIQYPRRSWFIRTTQFKDDMLANNERINWLPDHIKTGRFGKFLESNVDWSLSRERYWGTPLPIWVCESCGHAEALDSYDVLIAKPGVGGLEAWESARKADPKISEHLKVHKPYIDAVTYECPKCAGQQSRDRQGAVSGHGAVTRMKRVPEVIDCWYDSGAMPFAQWGFPHTGADAFGSQFPADFISEALDQTRGWFYSLVAIATMLFGSEGVARGDIAEAEYPIPFRNCIVLGLLMGEDGLKMSKSKKNYKEPAYIFENEGADAMRWLFFSGQSPWTSIRFQESAIAEGQREFLIRLYNCYSFFVIYANIDKWTPDQQTDEHHQTDLDRWIRSELAQCSRQVFDCMEAYDNYNAARALSDFVDALSNWYVRRNRDRFWRSEIDDDKRSAYATLHHCLVTVTKLIAPFTPFIADSMYQNLVRTHDADAPLSVHLCDYPITEANQAEVDARIDAALNDEVKLVRQLVSCGRAARSAAKLRVRQPLAAIELYHRQAEIVMKYDEIIQDELNVKRIDFVDAGAIDQYVHYEIKPDFKKIGPKHGPLAPKIKATLAKHPNVDGIVKQLETDGSYTMDVGGQDVELTADELLVELHAKSGYAAERIPGQGILVLDATITPELRDEGCARDLVNQVQQMRKKLDLRYEQRIDLAIIGGEEVHRVVNAYAEYIRGETLAQTLLNQSIAGAEEAQAEIEGHTANICVKPVE